MRYEIYLCSDSTKEAFGIGPNTHIENVRNVDYLRQIHNWCEKNSDYYEVYDSDAYVIWKVKDYTIVNSIFDKSEIGQSINGIYPFLRNPNMFD